MEKKPVLIAVSGVKNSGKTTLITKLIPLLTTHGLTVATIKHDGHDFDADVPGTDTYRHLDAGAYGTAVFSDNKYMVVKQKKGIDEKRLQDFFPEADLILLEGFKHSGYPKIEIVRKNNSSSPVCDPKTVLALATDGKLSACTKEESRDWNDTQVLDLNDKESIAELIYDYWYANTQLSMVVLAGGQSSRMGTDKSDLDYHGKTFLETQLEKGRRLGICEIVVSGYRGDECSAPVIKDRMEQKGPLGGLESCFRTLQRKRCLVLGVDIPGVCEQEIRGLIRKSRCSEKKVTIISHNGKEEPLLAVYDTDLSDAMCDEILHSKGSVFAFLRKSGYDVYESCDIEEQFQNINDRTIYGEVVLKKGPKKGK